MAKKPVSRPGKAPRSFPGIHEADIAARAVVKAWRASKTDLERHACERKLFGLLKGGLQRFCARFGTEWVLAEAYLHIPATCRLFDLTHRRMSVLGHWLQTLAWKLPHASVREHALIMPPDRLLADDRAALAEIRILHPDHAFSDVIGTFCGTADEARIFPRGWDEIFAEAYTDEEGGEDA